LELTLKAADRINVASPSGFAYLYDLLFWPVNRSNCFKTNSFSEKHYLLTQSSLL